MADTDEQAFQALNEISRQIPAGDRLLQVIDMADMAFRMTKDRIRSQAPGLSDREVFLRAAAERLGPEMASRVYGSAPSAGEEQ